MSEVDKAVGRDLQLVGVEHRQSDKANWNVHAVLEKFHGTKREGNLEATPYETIEMDGNLLVNAGIQLMEDGLISGTIATPFSNANTGLAVGTDNTAADPTNTTLNSENDRQPMEATFPSRASQTITFKGVFDDANSDGVWAEWGLFNNASSGGTMLNHKIAAMGTKSGGTWTLTVTVTIS